MCVSAKANPEEISRKPPQRHSPHSPHPSQSAPAQAICSNNKRTSTTNPSSSCSRLQKEKWRRIWEITVLPPQKLLATLDQQSLRIQVRGPTAAAISSTQVRQHRIELSVIASAFTMMPSYHVLLTLDLSSCCLGLYFVKGIDLMLLLLYFTVGSLTYHRTATLGGSEVSMAQEDGGRRNGAVSHRN